MDKPQLRAFGSLDFTIPDSQFSIPDLSICGGATWGRMIGASIHALPGYAPAALPGVCHG
jgi:hypothetical protein